MSAAAKATPIAIIVIGYVMSLAAYPMLPEPRWPVSAPFSSAFARLMIAFLLPSAAAAIYVLLSRVSKEPTAVEAAALKHTYSEILLTIVAFVVGLHALVLIGLCSGAAVAGRAVPALTGLACLVVGNVLPRTRPNFMVGIRTPATLANRDLWARVNRLAGYVTVGFGAALVLSAFVPSGRAVRNLVSACAVLAFAALVLGYRKLSHPGTHAQRSHAAAFGVAGWLLRVPVVVIFLYFGGMKFPDNPESPWPKLFAEIGFGQWFRYFTGALEVAGAILLVIPRTTVVAAAALACTMVGAILTHILVIGVGPAILPPIVLLVVLSVILRRSLRNG